MVSRGLTGLVQGFSRGAHSNSATLVCKASTTRCSMRRSTWSVPRSVESSSSTAAAGLAPSCDASSELFSFFFSTLVARTWGRDKQQAGFSLNQLLLEIVSNTNTSPSRLSIIFFIDCGRETWCHTRWNTTESIERIEMFRFVSHCGRSKPLPTYL